MEYMINRNNSEEFHDSLYRVLDRDFNADALRKVLQEYSSMCSLGEIGDLQNPRRVEDFYHKLRTAFNFNQ